MPHGYEDRRTETNDSLRRSNNEQKDSLEGKLREKLQAMSNNAANWKKEREERVRQALSEEDHEIRRDDEARRKRSELSDFSSELHRNVYEKASASDVIQRNKAYSRIR
jgi:lysyl-tRNA synthetase class I